MCHILYSWSLLTDELLEDILDILRPSELMMLTIFFFFVHSDAETKGICLRIVFIGANVIMYCTLQNPWLPWSCLNNMAVMNTWLAALLSLVYGIYCHCLISCHILQAFSTTSETSSGTRPLCLKSRSKKCACCACVCLNSQLHNVILPMTFIVESSSLSLHLLWVQHNTFIYFAQTKGCILTEY